MKTKLFRGLILSSLAMGFAVVNSARANPEGAVVVGGSATVSGAGTGNTVITQTSDRAIINWQDFSIGLGEITRFIQPGSDAAVLNRVLSGNPSQLLGTLQANGQVYLINPNGIVVGPSGVINAGSFVGSTLNVSDNQFMSGGNLDFLGSTMAGVENLGSINALGGNIFLFGHTVKNSGTIKADGTVGLAAGTKIELRQSGNERIGVLLGDASNQSAVGVDNQGLIQATSAEIQAAGGNIYAVAINNGGTIRAQPTLTMEGGKLVLKAVGGTVVNSGTLDASNPNGKGGTVEVLGDKVGLATTSVIDASGKTGGGKVLVGGDYQGKNAAVPNASSTFVSAGAVIKADATTVGDGGTIIIWSDVMTKYFGSISAKGGAQGGNGGFAEISGKQNLVFKGLVDLGAANGVAGSLLLDPSAIEIVAADPADGSYTTDLTKVDQAGDLNVGAAKTSIDVASINGAVGTVTLAASVSITQNAGATISTAADLVFTAPLITLNDSVTSASLSLNASLITLNGTGVTTTGLQNYNGSVILGANQTFNANNSTITFGSTLLGQDTYNVNATANGGLTFSGDVIQVVNLTINSTAQTTFSGKVTDVTAFVKNGAGNTTFNDEVVADSLTIAGTTLLNNGNVTTTPGGQTYTGAVTLGANATLSGVGINLNGGVVGGGFDLTLNDSTTTTLNGTFTGIHNLTTDVAGNTTINASITTTGSQTYNDKVTLGATVTLTGTDIKFGDTLNGAFGLTVNGSGTTTFAGVVGGGTALTSLTTDAAGTTAINGGTVTTTGAQVYNDAVTLSANTTVNAPASTVTFGSTVNGAFTLAVNNTSGTTTFGGVVGGTTPLTSVTTDATGTTAINGGGITTTGAQLYNDAVTLGADATLASTGGSNIRFVSTLDGGFGLTANTAGVTRFDTTVGGGTALASITTDAGGSTRIAGNITTSGAQTYNDAITLATGSTITSSGAGNITFGSTIDGANTLTVNTAGVTAFNGAVGTGTRLTSLTTDAAGSTTINTTDIRTAAGGQTYNDAVTLAASVFINSSGGGNVIFASTVNGAFALDITTSGTTTFGGIVGGSAALASLTTDANGSTSINTTAITTTGAQGFNDDVTLGANAVLTSTGSSNIQFAKTLNGAFSLTANTAGATFFGGVVGGNSPLTSITTDADGGTVFNTTAITTSGAQTYNDQVLLVKNVTVASTGSGAISFNNTIDGGKTLDVNTAGVTTFGGVIGGGTALTSLTTDATGSTTLNAGTVTTTGNQIYGDAVTLGAATTLNSTGAGQLRFSSTVDGAQALTLNTGGTTRFNGAVGAATALTVVTTDATGTTILNGSTVTTTGGQTYNDAVTVNNNQTLTSTGSGDIKFTTTVDGAKTLDVNTAGVTTFGGVVGGGTALTSLSTDAAGSTALNAGTVTTTGNQIYRDAVTLGANTTVTSTGAGNIRFLSTVDGAFSLAINTSGAGRFGGAVGSSTALTSITTDATGTTELNGGTVTTTGAQTYNDAVTLGANTTLSCTGSGNITLGGTTDGAFDLKVSTAGTATFTGAVGAATPLVNLDIQADAISFNAITTTTSVTLRSLTASKTLGVEDAGQNLNFTDAKLDGISTPLLTIGDSANTGGIKIATDNPVSQNKNLVFTTGGTVGLNGALSTTSGGTVTVNNGGLLTITAAGDMNLDGAFTQAGAGSVSTAGDISTTDDLVSFATDVTLTGNVLISTGAGNVTFNSTVDGGFGLTLNGSGINRFLAAVGGGTPLASVTTDAGGTTRINGGLVETTGAQSYGDAVTIGQLDAKVISTTAGAITFGSTLNGAQSLAVNTGGATTFTGAVGNSTALTSLTTDATGTTAVNGGQVRTTGAQTFNDAVTIGANTTFRSTGSGDIKFVTTLDGGFDATINTDGVTTFGGAVGATAALTSVTTDAGGSVVISGGSVKTTGNQLYNDPATLGAATVLTSTGAGNIRFFLTLDGAFDLTVNTSGTTRFDGVVGGTAQLTSLTTDATGTTQINGGAITTTGFQTYGDNIILGADTTLTSTALGDITFNGNINSDAVAARDLTVITGGATAFNGANVGNNNELDTITTDAPGTLSLKGTFNTVGYQLFQDPATLTGNVVNNVSGVGDVTYASTINGGFRLTVNTDETTIFGGPIGNTTELLSLTTDAGGTTQLNGGTVVNTSGFQTYGDAVVMGANATLTSSGGANITFGSTVDDNTSAGGANLTVNTTGNTIFTGAVGGNNELTSLTTDTGGQTRISGGLVKTSGNQTFGDAVIVFADTLFSSTASGNIWFQSTLDGDVFNDANANVTVNTQGLTTFQGRVGMADFNNGPTITSLTTDAGGTTRINSTVSVATSGAFNNLNDATVYTSGNQTYKDDVVLSPIDGGDVLLRSETGTISFAQRIDGTTFNLQGLKLIANNSSVNQSLIGNQTQLQFFDSSLTPSGAFQNITLTQNTEIVAGNVIFGTVTAGAFELTVTANDITFAAGANSVTGTSELTLRPISAASTIGIGGGAGTFNLDDADIAALADGFHSITIGRFDGTGLITVGSVTFRDPVRIESPGGSILVEGLLQSTATVAQGLDAANVFKTDINAAGARVDADTITTSGKNAYGLTAADAAPANGAGVLIFGLGSTTILQANIQTAGTAIFINDAVRLDTDASLITTAGGNVAGNDITVTGAINSIAGDNFGLTLRGGTGGNIDIQSTVGNTQALSDILVPNANNVSFDSTVNVTGAITFTAVNDITFANTVVAGGAITITSAHDANFQNTVNAGSIAQSAGSGTTTFTDNITTTTASGVNLTANAIVLDGLTVDSTTGNGVVRFNGPVTLSTADVTISAGSGNITFENTLDGGVNLTLNTSGTTTLKGLVGGVTPLTSLTTDAGGTTAINGGGITTTGNQTFNDDVTLSVAAVTLTGVDVTFNGTVNGPSALTVTASGTTTFGDATTDTVGATTPLSSILINGGGTTVFSSSIVTTTGTQRYDDAVTLNEAVNFTGSTVTFNESVTGPDHSFTVTGNAVLGDASTDVIATAALLVTGNTIVNAGAVNTTIYSQTYNGDVTLNTDVSFSGTTIQFDEDVLGTPNNLTVNGVAIFGNAANDVVNTGAILVTSGTTVNAGTVTTTGETQTYNGDVTITTAVNFTGTTVRFDEDIIAGANAVTITGNAIIGNAADDVANAGALTVTGTTTINASAISTTLNQIYTGAVTLGSDTTLTAGGTLLLSSTLDGNFDLALVVTGSSTFTGAVGSGAAIGDGAGAAITILSTGATEFQSTVNTASGIAQATGAGTVTFRGDVTIAAGDTDSTFNENVVLDGLTFTSTGGVTFGDAAADVVTLSGGPVTLVVTGTTTANSIVNGNQDLVINSTGGTTFNAAVGGTVAATEIGDGTGAAITIGAGAGPVTFAGTVRTKSGITQDGTAGLVTFNDDVTIAAGDTASTFNGNVTLDGLTFTTANAVTFGDATTDTLTLSTADVTITANSSGAAGAVTFNSAVDGAVALTVNTAGITTFNGVVGPNITTLTTDAAGTTVINTATIGGGVLDFNDAVILETSTTLTGTTSVDFAGTVNSAAAEANNLTVNSPVTGFHGVVGGTVGGELGTLTTDAAGTTTLDTTGISAAIVAFNDAVIVDQNLTITGTTSIDFASTVDSQVAEANNLTLNSPVTAFHAIVGGTTPLGTLSTDAAGTTTLDTTAISAAVVDFNDAVIVDQSLTITGTTSIDFASTVDSQTGEVNDLTLNSPVTGFHGIVGGTDTLGTLSTDAAGTTTLDTTAITVAVADFNDAVVVDQNLTLIGTTSVDFASTLNSAVNENNDLTINSPVTGFHGIVGAASPFGTLTTDAAGTTTIDTTVVVANVVALNDAVIVDQNLTITGITSIDFASTVDSQVAEANNLTLNSPVTGFHGIVGGTTPLGTLSTDAPGTTTIDTTTITAAVVDFNDAILLTQDVVINGTTSIDFASTVDSSGTARDLTLNSPTTGFHGVVGGAFALDVLTTDAAGTTTVDTTAINAAVIDFNDAIIIDVGTVLTGTTSVDFATTVNGQVGEANDLTINSPTTGFHGIVGGTTPLNTLTTDAAGTTTIDTTVINASVVDFNDAILLNADVVITGTTSVDFASTVDSSGIARDLTVNSPVTAFHGIVGGVLALDVLTTDAAGVTTIDTTTISGATLDFNDAVTLSQNVVLNGTTTVDFATTVNSDAVGTPRTLLVNSPLTVFGGAVGGSFPLASLTTDAPGITDINGGLVVTTGDQTYNDAVRLGADTVMNGNDISFNSTLNSSAATLRSLIVNSTGGGTTLFNGVVGGVDRLSHLETNADGQTQINAGTINLNGASALFNDPVVLLSATTINEAGVGAVTFNNILNGGFALVVNSTGGGATIFNGIVGGVTPLGSVTTDPAGATQINGGAVTTTGFQTYNDPVTIGANTVLNSTLAGNITFVTTLNGPFTLAVNTAGITTFGGVVGGLTPLNSITTDAPGSTSINGGAVTTFATQTYNDPVNLGATTLITSTGAAAAGNVTFNSTVNGAFALTVNTAGATTFNGAVGGGAALVSLTTDAPGTVAINGGAVTTTTFQTYNDPATIGANTVLTSTGAGNITFAQTLNGAFSLNANTAGQTIFNGVVGGAAPLTSVTTDAAGGTQVNGGAVTTTGFQLYNDPVTVGANALFTSTAAGNITFANTLNDDAVAGAANVTVNTAGITTFGGAVGGIAPLTSLTTDAPGSVRINGGLVTTTGNQTYNDPATLGADTTLNSLLAGNITFNQTLDDDGTVAPSNLIVNTAGITTFTGVVGGIAPLTSITTDFGGTAGDITAINGGAVTTTGFQLYNDNVTLNQDTVLTSTTVGNITIGMPNPPVPWGVTTLTGTVPGVDLIVNAFGGNVQINAAVSTIDTINGQAVATFIGANTGNTGIELYYSLPSAPFVFIFSQPLGAFNLNNKIYSVEEIFGRDAARLFPYPGDAMPIRSDISVLLTTNRVEKLIGTLPNDKILTSYDLAALDEARKNR